MTVRESGSFLDPEKELHKVWLFWVALLTPMFIGLGFGAALAYYNWGELCVSLELSCVNEFVPTYKVPIGLASVGLLLGTLVAQMHRSGQTLAAIRLSEKNNSFANRFKHEEEFLKFIDGIDRSTVDHSLEGMGPIKVKLRSSHILYLVFFPSHKGDLKAMEVNPEDVRLTVAQYLESIESELSVLGTDLHSDSEAVLRMLNIVTSVMSIEVVTHGTMIEDPFRKGDTPLSICTFEDLGNILVSTLCLYDFATTFMGSTQGSKLYLLVNSKSMPNLYRLANKAADFNRDRNEEVKHNLGL